MSPARKPVPGVRESVRRQIDKLDLNLLLCRDIGHKWVPATTELVIWEGSAVRMQHLACERGCDTEKDKWRDPHTGRSHSRMRYAAGYVLEQSGFLTIEERAYITEVWTGEFARRHPSFVS